VSAPPVFVVGCPRSGTTLLRLMLDAHPDLAIPPESHFIPLVARVRRRYERPEGFDAERMARDVFRGIRFRDWGLAEEAVLAEIRATRPSDLAGAAEAFFVAYARSRGKIRWGDKTPGYSLEMPLIASLYPSARFVHLVRDGRDVALSLMEVPRHPRSLAEAAEAWAHRIRVARRDAPSLGDRYLEVRYEDLVDDPETTVKLVAVHCDLPFAKAMLDHHRDDPADRVPGRNWGHHANLARPPTKGLRDWRRTMAEADQRLVEAIAGAELSALGYERRFPVVPAATRLRAAAGVAIDRARHAARALRVRAAILANPGSLPPPRRW
jgi:hypothetical protein